MLRLKNLRETLQCLRLEDNDEDDDEVGKVNDNVLGRCGCPPGRFLRVIWRLWPQLKGGKSSQVVTRLGLSSHLTQKKSEVSWLQ